MLGETDALGSLPLGSSTFITSLLRLAIDHVNAIENSDVKVKVANQVVGGLTPLF